MSETGFIKLFKGDEVNPDVIKHQKNLERAGYEVVNDGTDLQVECTEIIRDEVDITNGDTAKEFLKNLIANKQLLSYTGKFKITKKDGSTNVLPGHFALAALDRLCPGASAFMVKDKPTPVKAEPAFSLDDILDSE